MGGGGGKPYRRINPSVSGDERFGDRLKTTNTVRAVSARRSERRAMTTKTTRRVVFFFSRTSGVQKPYRFASVAGVISTRKCRVAIRS